MMDGSLSLFKRDDWKKENPPCPGKRIRFSGLQSGTLTKHKEFAPRIGV